MNLKNGFEIDVKYLLALFNSRLLNWHYQGFLKSTKKVFSEIQARQVAQIPIKKIDLQNQAEKEKHDKLVSLVDEITKLTKELNKTATNTDKHNRLKREVKALDQKIDQAVYKLYGLTNEEVKTIEK